MSEDPQIAPKYKGGENAPGNTGHQKGNLRNYSSWSWPSAYWPWPNVVHMMNVVEQDRGPRSKSLGEGQKPDLGTNLRFRLRVNFQHMLHM